MKVIKVVIIVCLFLNLPIFLQNVYTQEFLTSLEDPQILIEQEGFDQPIITNINYELNAKKTSPSNDPIKALDLISPSYTSLTISTSNPIIEGLNTSLSSVTTSAGYGVSSGVVDFFDIGIFKIDADIFSEVIYSNKFAIKITPTIDATIYGFAVNITPTIREDVNFYIRNTLTGPNLRTGLISGYITNAAHITNQMLYIPFQYCGDCDPLALTSSTDYYFLLEPTSSTSNTFFELSQSSDTPDNLGIFEWWNLNYEFIYTDVNFYLITSFSDVATNVEVNDDGEAFSQWTASNVGNHSLIAWYERSTFYAESYGSQERSVIPSDEVFLVTLDPIVSEYKDKITFSSTVMRLDSTPSIGTTVGFYVSEDESNWILVGNNITDSNGLATLSYIFDLFPDNYFILAKVNGFSMAESFLLINPESIIWENINFHGRYRNNIGQPSFTKLTATILVKDNDGNTVPNMAFDLWYKIDGEFEHIPHYYITNTSGYVTINHAVEDLFVGNYLDSHYFCSADYEYGYIGDSNFGDTIVDKGLFEVELPSYSIKWNDDLSIVCHLTSLGEGWSDVDVQFLYYSDLKWNNLGSSTTNATGYSTFIWENIPLTLGVYFLKVVTIENSLFESSEQIADLLVDRKGITIYIINSAGQAKGNGEVIDLEYTSTMHLIFYACYDDNTPASNVIIAINGRLLDEFFYRNIGYTITNSSGYALFNNYENLTLVGNQYACLAEILQNGCHEEAQLYFKINLTRCTPYIIIQNQMGEKGAYTELIALVKNSEGMCLRYVQVQFIINGVFYYGVSDYYGYIRVKIAPQFSTGNYILFCNVIEDEKYNFNENQAIFTLTKGLPFLTLYYAYTIKNGYLTIKATAYDALGRPIADLIVRISFLGWSELLTTDENGKIEYTFLTTGFDCGTYLSVLVFEGNNDWLSVTTTGTILIYQAESTLELITSPINGVYGEEITIQAILKSIQGIPLENCLIQIIIVFSNGTLLLLGENFTNGDGLLTFQTLLSITPGLYDIELFFVGTINFGPATKFTIFTILKSNSLIKGNDFQTIIDSIASFSVTLLNVYGKPITFVEISIYIWANNSWIILGKFLTNKKGIAMISLLIPLSLGLYDLKVVFNGNECYNGSYLNLQMRVIEPPPKIHPDINIQPSGDIFVEQQAITFEIFVSNAINGSAFAILVYVNDVYNGTIFIINGYGVFYWIAPQIGVYNISFIAIENSAYYSTTSSISIDIISNIPPTLISYTFVNIICEGDVFIVEAMLSDISGIKSVWFFANGTLYEMSFNGHSYMVTIYTLKQGIYIIGMQAIDNQNCMAIYDLSPLLVLERKTQVMKYHFNSLLLEEGEEFHLEVLIYSVNSLNKVYAIINSTEYLMDYGYRINDHQSVWHIKLGTLVIGSFEIKIKLLENNVEIVNKINLILVIIPKTPLLEQYVWYIERNKNEDFIFGNITINSYYPIDSVEIWIDGIKISVLKINENMFTFSGYVSNSNRHILKLDVVDIMGRILISEFPLMYGRSFILIISLVIVSIVVTILIGFGIFLVYRQLKKNSHQTVINEVDVPEICVGNISESKEKEQTNSNQITNEKSAQHLRNRSSKNSINKKAIKLSGNTTNQNPSSLPQSSYDEDSCEDLSNNQIESIKQNSNPQLVHVKDYIKKVKQEGLIPKKEKNKEVEKSIEDLSTLDVEIDTRVLPESEKVKNDQENNDSNDLNSLTLKDITDEIELTFTTKRKTGGRSG